MRSKYDKKNIRLGQAWQVAQPQPCGCLLVLRDGVKHRTGLGVFELHLCTLHVQVAGNTVDQDGNAEPPVHRHPQGEAGEGADTHGDFVHGDSR